LVTVRPRYRPGDSGITEIHQRVKGPFLGLDGIPATIVDPELGGISVPSVRTVVLPAPLGPRKPDTSRRRA
jgi:hypothetical protein